MKITRKRFQPGGFLKNEEKLLEIDIKKGWKVITKYWYILIILLKYIFNVIVGCLLPI